MNTSASFVTFPFGCECLPFCYGVSSSPFCMFTNQCDQEIQCIIRIHRECEDRIAKTRPEDHKLAKPFLNFI